VSKEAVLKSIIKSLEDDLASMEDAVKDAHVTATHEETAAKSKYDTFALEASYLANGQVKRAQEIKEALDAYRTLDLLEFTQNSAIDISALVVLEKDGAGQTTVFIGPLAGGTKVTCDDREITVITPQSPLGQHLMEKAVGDEFELGSGDTVKEYQIIEVE